MTSKAIAAIRAAKNFKSWGEYTTAGFLKNNAVSERLFNIARRCEATIGRPFESRVAHYSSLNGLI